MPDPSFSFGFMIATLYGAGFHLVWGGGAHRLLLFLVAGWLGFAFGHIVGVLFEITMLSVGALRFLPASVAALLILFAAQSLTGTKRQRSSTRSR